MNRSLSVFTVSSSSRVSKRTAAAHLHDRGGGLSRPALAPGWHASALLHTAGVRMAWCPLVRAAFLLLVAVSARAQCNGLDSELALLAPACCGAGETPRMHCRIVRLVPDAPRLSCARRPVRMRRHPVPPRRRNPDKLHHGLQPCVGELRQPVPGRDHGRTR